MRAIWIMLSNCTDRARDAEYNEWYNKTHIPDLTATPGILSGQRYKDLRPHRLPDEPLYMAVYTVEWGDPWALLRRVAQVDDKKREAQGRMIDCLKAVLLSVWQPLGGAQFAASKHGTARLDGDVPKMLMLIMGNPVDVTTQSDFDAWFNSDYLSGLLKMPGVVWGQCFRTMRPKLRPGDCSYVALLAVDSPDNLGLLGRVAGDAGSKGKGRAGLLDIRYSSVFEHVGP